MSSVLSKLFGPKTTTDNRRRDPRVEVPQNTAILSVDGAPYPLKNWSAWGFLAGSYSGNREVGDKCLVNISVKQDPFAIAFAAEVVIVRKESGDLAGRFVFLPPENMAQIEAYFAYHTRVP
ncbi:MAG: hypothetical protein FJX54_03965 [Alphaproteobacteria bacterium]|nr:hypothetical protein [Alphaproteobacteria bacterium]